MIKEKVDMSTMTRDDLYAEFLKSKLKKSQEDKKNGRFTTLEEFRIEMEEMYKEDYHEKRKDRGSMIKEKVDMSTMTKDELYAEFLKSKLRESEDDIKNGRFMSIEESKERMRKKYEGLNI